MLNRKQLLVLLVLVILVASFFMFVTGIMLPNDIPVVIRLLTWIPRGVLAWIVGFHSCEIFLNDFIKLKQSIDIVMKDEDKP